MASFSDVLTKTAESIERPPLPPKGTYVFVVNGNAKVDKRGDYEAVDFPLKGVRPAEDVDMDALALYGSPSSIIARKSFLFNTTDDAAFKQTEFQLREFLTTHLGLPAALSVKELVSMAVNKQCLGVVDYRPDKNNPEIMYVDVRRTAPIDA